MRKITFIDVVRFIPAAFIICVSWYLSSQERLEHMPSFWNADKVVHTICFAGLAFWVAFGFRIERINKFWISALFVSVYGIIDEIHQSFTPGRESSFFDWTADTVGACIGSCVFVLFVSFLRKKLMKKSAISERV